MLNNYCNSCDLDVTIDGHAGNCAVIVDEYRNRRSEKLFRDAQFKLDRRSRTVTTRKKIRQSRAQVRVSRSKSDGTHDRRYKWEVA